MKPIEPTGNIPINETPKEWTDASWADWSERMENLMHGVNPEKEDEWRLRKEFARARVNAKGDAKNA